VCAATTRTCDRATTLRDHRNPCATFAYSRRKLQMGCRRHETSSDAESDRAASGALGRDVLASARPCPVCGHAMAGRNTSACSHEWCAAWCRRRRCVPLPVAEAQAIRAKLTAALRTIDEAKATWEQYGSG